MLGVGSVREELGGEGTVNQLAVVSKVLYELVVPFSLVVFLLPQSVTGQRKVPSCLLRQSGVELGGGRGTAFAPGSLAAPLGSKLAASLAVACMACVFYGD